MDVSNVVELQLRFMQDEVDQERFGKQRVVQWRLFSK
jgi:hypothetical protein